MDTTTIIPFGRTEGVLAVISQSTKNSISKLDTIETN